MDLYLLITIGVGSALIIFLFITLRATQSDFKSKTKEYEKQLEEKEKEMSEVVEELRTTQLKLMESGKISALASLSAGILHQVSQPITAIHGFAKFLKKEMDDKETFYKPVCLIEEQSVYLKEMLGDLMDLIRHREIQKEDINVNDVIYKAVNLLKDELRIRRVNWELDLDDQIPMIHADGTHLQQIFMNIIVNAIQAMSELPRGSEKFLKIVTYSQPKESVFISFQDTGPGVEVDGGDEAQIFEPFYSKKAKGAGIGLALCQDLIAEHGGTITVEKNEPHGANFIIKLAAVDSK